MSEPVRQGQVRRGPQGYRALCRVGRYHPGSQSFEVDTRDEDSQWLKDERHRTAEQIQRHWPEVVSTSLDAALAVLKDRTDGTEDEGLADAALSEVAELRAQAENLRVHLERYVGPHATALVLKGGVLESMSPGVADLLEAVRPLMPWATALCITYSPDYLGTPKVRLDLLTPVLTLSFARRLVAAVQAVEAGATP